MIPPTDLRPWLASASYIMFMPIRNSALVRDIFRRVVNNSIASTGCISANTRRWWDLSSARQLGYEPLDDAERWAAEIEAVPPTETDDLDARHVGGDFARPFPSPPPI